MKRATWQLGILGLILAALVGCGQAQETTKTGEEKKAGDVKVTVPQTIPGKQDPGAAPVAKPAQPGGSPIAKSAASPVPKTAASPAPKTAASPAPAAKTAASPAAGGISKSAPAVQPQRGTPQGQVVYAWHTALSPQWYDPQENTALITPYAFQYALHDAVIKHVPGEIFAPSLAQSYEVAPDFRSATITLRDNIKFHNGEPVTSEDVKFTYENYRGANAGVLHDKTQSIETPDAKTVKFNFKEPFLDFLVLYGSPASGAGWVVPAKYYQEVGPDGFKQNPIGAGPFKFVRQTPGTEIELEAFEEYWRKTPNVKTLVIRGVTEASTRVAQLQTGEADFVNQIPGELIPAAQSDPNIDVTATLCCPFWLEFVEMSQPDSPFSNPKVREAVSLAIDREALNQAETAGLSPIEGNWIPEDWPGAVKFPAPEYDPDRAKQLLAEAGYPDGFEVGVFNPWPPYFSLGERVITQLREVGIRVGRMNTMERGAFSAALAEGPSAFEGIVMHVSGAPGDAAARIRTFAICDGSNSLICVPEIDEKFAKYEASNDPQERERLLTEIQQLIHDQHIFIPLYRLAFVVAQGPKIANPTEEVWGSIPQYIYVGPYEDIRLQQ